MAGKIGKAAVCEHQCRIFRIRKRLTLLVPLMLVAGISVAQAPDKTIGLPPITMIVDNAAYAKTQASGQSEIRNITSSNSDVATAREWGTNDVQKNAKAEGRTTIRFYDRAHKTYYLVRVKVNPRPPKPVAPEPEKKPAGGGGGAPAPARPRRAVVIDKCLVGTWRSESIEAAGEKLDGGSGILLTFAADGEVTIDYSEMKPLVSRNGNNDIISKNEWTGKASVHISIDKDKAVKIESVEGSDISIKITNSDGTTDEHKSSRLGPAGLGRPPNLGYTCDETTLTYETGAFKITFKKVK